MYSAPKQECKTFWNSWIYIAKPSYLSNLHIPYCPEQAPMGTRSSSTKIWGWVVTWRKYLNGSTIFEQGPTLGCEVGSHGAKSTCIVVSSMLHRGQPDSGEGCIVLQSEPTRSLVAKFPHVQSSPAVCKFCAAREERCEPGHWQVCANLMSWHPKHIRAMWAQQTYLRIHYARI